MSRPAAVLLVLTVASLAGAQAPGRAALGLTAVGALGVHVGGAAVQRGAKGGEVAAVADFGHLPSRRIRVTAEVAFLRTQPYAEYVADDDTTYRNVFYDLSGHVGLTLLGRLPETRVLPYATAAVGVHALTSSFGTLTLDRRYNSNVFGLLAGAGLRLRPGAEGWAVTVEARRVQARNVSRTSLHLGLLALLGDQR